MTVMTIIGARPQFIKAAPFSREFRKSGREILVHTGQHYDKNMSDVFFDELGIPKPDYNLGIGSGSHGAQTGRMLEAIEELLLSHRPDGMLVYGDTNSTLAGALAASKLHIPVFHVEAGLRSHNMLMPEEQNRILTDHISSLLLCPTETAVQSLAHEGITRGVYNTGDIMLDAVRENVRLAGEKYPDMPVLTPIDGDMPRINPGEYYLATVHRAENTDDPAKLRAIFEAFSKMSLPVILPIHPRTRKLIADYGIRPQGVIAVEPVGYLPMLWLTSHAKMVLTDSGGLQKEAYFMRTPCVTMRDQTEWVETLEGGWNVLTQISPDSILSCAERRFDTSCPQNNAFGDGKAAEKITGLISEFLARGGEESL